MSLKLLTFLCDALKHCLKMANFDHIVQFQHKSQCQKATSVLFFLFLLMLDGDLADICPVYDGSELADSDLKIITVVEK